MRKTFVFLIFSFEKAVFESNAQQAEARASRFHNEYVNERKTMEKLKIVSENEDWCGEWTRDEVEAEIREMGCDGDWLEWVFDHDLCGYPPEILHALQFFDVHELIADIGGFRTRFVKTRA